MGRKPECEKDSEGLCDITDGMKGIEEVTAVLRATAAELAVNSSPERLMLIRYALAGIINDLDVHRLKIRDGSNKMGRERDRLVTTIRDLKSNGGEEDGNTGEPNG